MSLVFGGAEPCLPLPLPRPEWRTTTSSQIFFYLYVPKILCMLSVPGADVGAYGFEDLVKFGN